MIRSHPIHKLSTRRNSVAPSLSPSLPDGQSEPLAFRMEMSRRDRPPLSPRRFRAVTDPREMVAVAQVAAWRDAWKAGASFVTLELVAHHVQEPLEWVREHWDDDPRSALPSGYATEAEYAEPPAEKQCSIALSDCCERSPDT